MLMQVQTHATPGEKTSASAANGNILQRKCACEENQDQDEESRGMLQRKAFGQNAADSVPPLVHRVLSSPGTPLDGETRAFMEPRLSHDFSQVRVHADAQADESARSVGALAYTVGRDLVFGAGQYAPQTESGKRLIAHELTHVVQQNSFGRPAIQNLEVGGASTPAEAEAERVADGIFSSQRPMSLAGSSAGMLQRACSSDPQCATGMPRSLRWAVTTAQGAPAQQAKTSKRQALCSKVPPDPACTADGHGAPAPQLTAVIQHFRPSRLREITGIFIDKDIPGVYGAYTTDCSAFTPPLPGGQCTFVPQRLEDEAKLFNTTNTQHFSVGTRSQWINETVETIQHETEHARVTNSPTVGQIKDPSGTGYATSDLSEISAILSEFEVVYSRAQRLVEPARSAEINAWFEPAIKTRGECIKGNVDDVRCFYDCDEAQKNIKQMVEFTTKDWNTNALSILMTELKKPKWGLNWPVDPPVGIQITDLPTPGPTLDIEDLPSTK